MDAAAGCHTPERLSSLSIRDLRDLAKDRGVKVRGTKEELVNRLSSEGAGRQDDVVVTRPPVRPRIRAGPCKRKPDLAFDFYGPDRPRRLRLQTKWFVPAVIRDEIEDDATSDSHDIECDEDETHSSIDEFEDADSSPGGQTDDECTEIEDPVQVEETGDECVEVCQPTMKQNDQNSDKAAGNGSAALNFGHPSGSPTHQTSMQTTDKLLSRMDEQIRKMPGEDD